MNTRALALACLVSISWALLPASAAELHGVKMPDTVTVAGKPLTLNGMGTREATFLKIKAYVAALFVEKASKDAQEILNTPQLKQVRMSFLRDVGADKIRDAWKGAVEKNCRPPAFAAADCAALQPTLEKLNAAMGDMKKGESMTLTFFPERLEIKVRDAEPMTFEGMMISRLILMVWLGKEPPNESLKEGMLGLSRS